MKRINVPMRLVLGLPFNTPLGGRLMLLRHTGRRTGRTYRQPISYVPDGDTLLTPGGGRWKLNLREGEPVTLHLRGRDITATPEFIPEAAEVERLLRHMIARNPRMTAFVPFVGRDGTIEPAQLENALSHGFCIVRWHLDPATRP
jgi:deazaflavin-dependent oxidoreductase (nitroreductase family)